MDAPPAPGFTRTMAWRRPEKVRRGFQFDAAFLGSPIAARIVSR